jgi:predicted HNH restriction endonuclease
MNEGLARAISRLPDLERLNTFEANAVAQNRLDDEMRAAIRDRQIELGKVLVAERTGLDLSRLTPAEEGIVRAASEYVSIKRRAGTNAQRTLKQLSERGLIGAAEASVMRAKPTKGYDELVQHGLADLSYEQIVIDHPEEFSDRAIWFSRRTLGLQNENTQPPVRGSSSTQRRTVELLDWLAARAREFDGRLGRYTNADAARALGMTDMAVNGRVFGNIQSRVDLACYRAGLPPLGLTAVAPFAEAWQSDDRSWSFPVTAMRKAAETFHWVDRDFDRARAESEMLPGQASIAWHEELATREGKVRAWAHGLVSHQRSSDDESPDGNERSNQPNPDWTRDELILALEAYMRYRVKSFSKTSNEILELSSRLRALAVARKVSGGATFRNANGAYMKLMNLRSADPEYDKKGLGSANKLEMEVWASFGDNAAALQWEVSRILAEIERADAAAASTAALLAPLSDEAMDAISALLGIEGTNGDNIRARIAMLDETFKDASPEKKQRVSSYIERGPMGAEVKKANGYKCQICEALGANPIGFKKKKTGIPYIEAHHVILVSTGQIGTLSSRNVMTLCANHHREIHYGDILVEATVDRFVLTHEGKRLEILRFGSMHNHQASSTSA